jgi:hypothetical protein
LELDIGTYHNIRGDMFQITTEVCCVSCRNIACYIETMCHVSSCDPQAGLLDRHKCDGKYPLIQVAARHSIPARFSHLIGNTRISIFIAV